MQLLLNRERFEQHNLLLESVTELKNYLRLSSDYKRAVIRHDSIIVSTNQQDDQPITGIIFYGPDNTKTAYALLSQDIVLTTGTVDRDADLLWHIKTKGLKNNLVKHLIRLNLATSFISHQQCADIVDLDLTKL